MVGTLFSAPSSGVPLAKISVSSYGFYMGRLRPYKAIILARVPHVHVQANMMMIMINVASQNRRLNWQKWVRVLARIIRIFDRLS